MIFGYSPKFIKSVRLNDGKYEGLWSGNVVEIPFQDGKIEIRTSNGVRGINIPCIVSVSGDQIEIKTTELSNE